MAGQRNPQTSNWEFLLQQEGDRSWLPLESPDVEILEGRYRVLVRSGATNAAIEIRITHEATEETPPRRRTQSRSGRTSPDGLMVVMPFTMLQPGIWELSCATADLSSELLGYQGAYSVQLHVLPKELDNAGEWDPDWRGNSIQPMQPPVAPPKMPPNPKLAVVDTDSPPASRAEAVAKPAVVEPLIEPVAEPIAEPIAANWESLNLQLTPDTYDCQPGQTLILKGELTAEQPGKLEDCTFVIEVLDPQSGNVVVETPIAFTQIQVPFNVELGVVLPSDLTGQLFLGEVRVMNGEAIATRMTFTLLGALENLLATMPNQVSSAEREEDGWFMPDPTPAGPVVEDEFLGMVNREVIPSRELRPATGSTLPPKLYPPDPDRPGRSSVSLPSFLSNPVPAEDLETLFDDDWQEAEERSIFDMADDEAIAVSQPAEDANSIDLMSEEAILAEVPELDRVTGDFDGLEAALPEKLYLDESNDLDGNLDGIYNWTAPLDLDDPDDLKTIDIGAERIDSTPDSLEPNVDQFEALNLGDRFLDRINTLAETNRAEAINAIPPEPDRPVNPFAVSRPAGMETVVLDDPVIGSRSEGSENAAVMPEDEPIPLPRLEIESVQEVVAGQTLAVRVKLPDVQPKLYVKLWINDRSTRTLMDGPRYLVDFLSSAEAQTLEATTTLTIPLGSLEIQIEAITIETATKRESYKATAPLTVIPPNLPEFSVDDWG